MNQALALIAEAKRTRATRLDLGNCGLTELPDELSELIDLEVLILSENRELKDLASLKDLANLQQLSVSSTQVSDLTPLKDLANLQQLYVYSTQVSDLTPLKDLANLQQLDVQYTQVSDLTPLKDLANLQQLDVQYTQVSDLTPLKDLANLQQLNVSSTQVSDLTPLKDLANLQQLYVSSTQVSDLTPLKDLANLQQLDVSSTQVSDLTPLKDLANLQQLYVQYTQVSDLTPLKDLANLQQLYVYSTQVSDLTPLKDLANLQQLNVYSTQVSDLTPLKELANLQLLDVSSTQVSDLTPLKDLANLQQLNVPSTQVSDLTPLKELANLQLLDVRGCPIQNIPKEIYDQLDCAKDLFAYWQELKTAQNTQNKQLKVLFLGNGCVGKSTLLHWFLNNEFTPISLEEGRTHGIYIKPFPFKNSDILANFWDFGGQEVYHATHRLFLGRRSLYVLVWATESPEFNDDLQHPPQYWLDMIADMADRHEHSRVLIVQNLFDGQTERNILSDAERADYEAKGLDITTYCVNAKKGLKIKSLMSAIEEEAEQLLKTHVEELPETWVNIRKTVAERRLNGEKILPQTDFEVICQDCQLSTAPSVILDYLHRAGELFYYQDHFENQIILDQEWALKAVYGILKRKNIDQFKGRIRREQLVEMWKNDFLIQSDNEADIFLNFMLANKIAFYTEGGYFSEKDNAELVIPQLLPLQKPEMYSLWEDRTDKLRHRIVYQFLHRDIIERFIVQTAHLSKKKEYWRNGLFINYLDSKAVVEVVPMEGEKDKKQIQIECVGAAKQGLLQKIREEFNKIRTLDKATEKSFENGEWLIFSDKTPLQRGESSGFEPPHKQHINPSKTIQMSVKEQIENWVAKGKLTEALQLMSSIAATQGKDFRNTVILLSGQNASNESDNLKGIIEESSYRRTKARLSQAILGLLESEFDENRIPTALKNEILALTEKPEKATDTQGGNINKTSTDLREFEKKEKSTLKILMLTANPAETTKLNLAKEHSKIAGKLQNVQSKFLLTKYDAVDRTEFKEKTESTQPDILHFSGHGEKGGEYGGIILQNEDRNGYEMLSDTKLDALFEYFKDEFSMQAVVLNACFSQEQAAAIARHVPYVIGTTTQVIDDHAIAFSIGFYFKLVSTQGLDFEKAFKSGRIEAINAGAAKQDFIIYKNGLLLGI